MEGSVAPSGTAGSISSLIQAAQEASNNQSVEGQLSSGNNAVSTPVSYTHLTLPTICSV